MADVYAKVKREGTAAPTTGNIIVTDDAGGLFADINDGASVKFGENGGMFIETEDATHPTPIAEGIKPVTERKVYYGLPSINGSKEYTSETNIIAAEGEIGKEDQILRVKGGKLVFADEETHTHGNKPALDNIKNDGEGNKYLSDGGTYKEINIPNLSGDNITIKIENDKVIAIGLDGLTVDIATLNLLTGLDKNIMEYIKLFGNSMKFKGVVETDDDLNAIENHEEGWTYIVKDSASNDNKTMTFISNGTSFDPVTETTVEVRDFTTNPINLNSEVTGILSADKISTDIARLTDIPKANESSHTHENKDLLDRISSNGEGNKYLSDDGTYKEIEYDDVLDDTSENAPTSKAVKKYIDTNSITVDSRMSVDSLNPVQNKVVTEYIDILRTDMQEATKVVQSTTDLSNSLKRTDDGLFVENLMPYVNRINYAQKTCRDNTREYIRFSDDSNESDVNSYYVTTTSPINIITRTNKIQTNINEQRYIDKGYVTLKAGITYNIIANASNDTSTYPPVFQLVDSNGVGLSTIKYCKLEVTYTPVEDIDVTVNIFNSDKYSYNTSIIVSGTTTLYIEAVEPTVIDPVEYVDNRDGLQDNPVGTVIAYLGNTAPHHYLICDGSEYQITDYPYLSQHIKDNFGTENYYGGDGIETFAVPDLRAEFLRGAGVATRQTGEGAEVGQHQDPTTISTEGYGGIGFTTGSNVTPTPVQPDEINNDNVTPTTNVVNAPVSYSAGSISARSATSESTVVDENIQLSMRPTATSVNWCIKAEPTYYLVVEAKNI